MPSQTRGAIFDGSFFKRDARSDIRQPREDLGRSEKRPERSPVQEVLGESLRVVRGGDRGNASRTPRKDTVGDARVSFSFGASDSRHTFKNALCRFRAHQRRVPRRRAVVRPEPPQRRRSGGRRGRARRGAVVRTRPRRRERATHLRAERPDLVVVVPIESGRPRTRRRRRRPRRAHALQRARHARRGGHIRSAP